MRCGGLAALYVEAEFDGKPATAEENEPETPDEGKSRGRRAKGTNPAGKRETGGKACRGPRGP